MILMMFHTKQARFKRADLFIKLSIRFYAKCIISL